MKVQLRSRIGVIVVERKIKTATNFAEVMTAAGYPLSLSQAARYINANPPPAMTVEFIETACNVLQCMPHDLFDMTVFTEAGEMLDPALSIPPLAKRVVEAPPPPPPAPASTQKATPKVGKANVPWAEKYGVAGPKIKPLPTPKPKE